MCPAKAEAVFFSLVIAGTEHESMVLVGGRGVLQQKTAGNASFCIAGCGCITHVWNQFFVSERAFNISSTLINRDSLRSGSSRLLFSIIDKHMAYMLRISVLADCVVS